MGGLWGEGALIKTLFLTGGERGERALKISFRISKNCNLTIREKKRRKKK
ncbi:hypothetical protein X928_09735 [Petrotoga miotherma DSM 10691]|uniref:Uncharacterized protein n=1 Tax=Petrotoga miotherma DSM 10691 TaxID=1434326 RepID=A0A2K1P3S2_9BACT|nr:hypothetical protein X928_09735 [Petrotoga miotherma DSM 10691]